MFNQYNGHADYIKIKLMSILIHRIFVVVGIMLIVLLALIFLSLSKSFAAPIKLIEDNVIDNSKSSNIEYKSLSVSIGSHQNDKIHFRRVEAGQVVLSGRVIKVPSFYVMEIPLSQIQAANLIYSDKDSPWDYYQNRLKEGIKNVPLDAKTKNMLSEYYAEKRSPAIGVYYDDVRHILYQFNSKTGVQLRLPTVAEWVLLSIAEMDKQENDDNTDEQPHHLSDLLEIYKQYDHIVFKYETIQSIESRRQLIDESRKSDDVDGQWIGVVMPVAVMPTSGEVNDLNRLIRGKNAWIEKGGNFSKYRENSFLHHTMLAMGKASTQKLPTTKRVLLYNLVRSQVLDTHSLGVKSYDYGVRFVLTEEEAAKLYLATDKH